MSRHITLSILILAVCAAVSGADTFKHRQTGETFTGFVTQKENQGRTLVYSEKDKNFSPLPLAEYEVTRDNHGRRNSVVFIPIRNEEAIISQDVAQTIADTIVDASNKGPRYIVLEIDSPGGRGDFMKIITTAIAATDNCPVIAYISGGPFGGAYAAAGPVALACEKIYIAGDAVMGSAAPVVGRNATAENVAEYQELYNSDTLAGFASYTASLAAKRNRPLPLAMALLDKSIEIIEVDGPDGNRVFIPRPDLKPQQTIVRTVSKIETKTLTERDAGGATTVREITQMVLTLRAQQAVAAKLADKLVGSRDELLADLGAADAQITYTRGVENAVRKYVAAKRNVQSELVQVDYLQQRTEQLQAQLNRLDEQVRTNPTTIEQRRYDTGLGGETFYRGTERSLRRVRETRVPTASRRSGLGRTDSVVIQEPSAAAGQLVNELAMTLADLVRSYRRVIGLVRRDPGVLPTTVTIDSLQRNLDAAIAMQNALMIRFR
ncbi:MAG: hypothetical protein IH624_04080 [Phycisphaerae bacterium]|nr:hypothetical protein [Phycisphaerae bacterium]